MNLGPERREWKRTLEIVQALAIHRPYSDFDPCAPAPQKLSDLLDLRRRFELLFHG